MKTTIELPDALLRKAKIAAARRNTSLKSLLVEGLQHVLGAPAAANPSNPNQRPEFFDTDEYGVPVIKRRGTTVTSAEIEVIREREGI